MAGATEPPPRVQADEKDESLQTDVANTAGQQPLSAKARKHQRQRAARAARAAAAASPSPFPAIPTCEKAWYDVDDHTWAQRLRVWTQLADSPLIEAPRPPTLLQRHQRQQQQIAWYEVAARLWQLDGACVRAGRGEPNVEFSEQPRPWHVAQALAMRTAAAKEENFDDSFDFSFIAYDIALHVVKHHTFPEESEPAVR